MNDDFNNNNFMDDLYSNPAYDSISGNIYCDDNKYLRDNDNFLDDLYSEKREDSLDKIFKDDKETKNAVAGLFVIVLVVLMILGFINGGS